MELYEIIRPEHINIKLMSKTKYGVLNELAELLDKSGVLKDKASFLNDVLKRERVFSTGIGNGIAIPHGKSKFVKETSVAIGISKKGLEWETFDGNPVKFVVLLAVSEDEIAGSYVHLLSKMAKKLASEEVCKRLSHAGTVDEIINIFS